ncbi:MAG: glycosyltransferase family A protein [Actinomycetaceae bacterium]|nr:glycosyltransferase family A protein [Actinomycetaceae bacterium]MDY6082252.1 glycosyltransferase family A protein [Actinomycetaceae bacterium]
MRHKAVHVKKSPCARERELTAGISVVIAAYHAVRELPVLLDCCAAQTLAPALFEIIVVCNGDDDGSSAVVEHFAQAHPQVNVVVHQMEIANAGAARNAGIRLASRQFLTFVDADDKIGPRYLEAQWSAAGQTTSSERAAPSVVVLSPLVSVSADGRAIANDPLSKKYAAVDPGQHKVADYPWVLSFTACKLLPTKIARSMRFPEDLRSGEDVVFWAQLLRFPNLRLILASKPREVEHVREAERVNPRVNPEWEDAAYVRVVRPDSVSRQGESFDFNVVQRLACIDQLRTIRVPVRARKALRTRIAAQLDFVVKYLGAHRNEAPAIQAEVLRHPDGRALWRHIVKRRQKRDR